MKSDKIPNSSSDMSATLSNASKSNQVEKMKEGGTGSLSNITGKSGKIDSESAKASKKS